ncbi:MAG: glycosyltransferase family 39 protein [Prevotella sp.]|nr:glycosyltransferase family 39 protein [Prevotella sp.]
MQDSHCQIKVIGIVAIFTLLQLLILLIFGYTPYTDSIGYVILAKDSIKYGESYPIASKIQELAFIWNIGSINTVALSLKLFHSITPLLIVYTLMKGISSWLVYAISKELFNHQIAWITLIIYILYPANYGEGTSLLSETPFMFFILSGFYLSLKNKPLLGGILLALANWYRPMALVFLISLVVYFIIVYKRQCIKHVSLTIVGFILMIIVIGGTCYLRTGHFIYQAKTGWMALMQYSWDHDNHPEKTTHLFANGNPNDLDNQGYNSVQKDSVWRNHFMIWLQHNPMEYLAQMPKKFVDTYISDNVNFCVYLKDKATSDYMYDEVSMRTLIRQYPRYSWVQILVIVNLLFYYLILLSSLYSMISCMRKRQWNLLILPFSVIVLGTLLLLFFGHGEARFHIPFMPFFIMLCSLNFMNYEKKVVD